MSKNQRGREIQRRKNQRVSFKTALFSQSVSQTLPSRPSNRLFPPATVSMPGRPDLVSFWSSFEKFGLKFTWQPALSLFPFAPSSLILPRLPSFEPGVGVTGFEPVTLRLSSACSNQLSYTPFLEGLEARGVEPLTYSLQSYRSTS
jgi:hypothetical protein